MNPRTTKSGKTKAVSAKSVTGENLFMNENFAELLLDTVPESIAILDKNGVIIRVNQSWKMFADQNGLKKDSHYYVGNTYWGENLLDGRENCRNDLECVRKGIKEVIEGKTDHFSLEYPCHSPDEKRWFEMRVVPLKTPHKSVPASEKKVMVMHMNITKLKQLELNARKHSALYQASEKISKVGGWEWHVENQTMYWTDETYRIHGYDRTKIPSGSDSHIQHSLDCYFEKDRPIILKAFQKCSSKGVAYDMEFPFRKTTGEKIWIRTTAKAEMDGNKVLRVIGNIADITERKKNEIIQNSRLHLLQYAGAHSLEDLLEETLNEIEKITGSQIGFFHFVDADEKTLLLQNWSTATMKNFCKAEAHGLHYPVEQAGVWVDCVKERRPVIHNNYEALPYKKGIPDGHARVIRELVVPIFRDNKIVAILGTGNKETDYDREDVEIVEKIADLAWEIVSRKKADMVLADNLQKLKESETRVNDYNQILTAVLDNTSISAVLLDNQFNFIWVNPAYAKGTGHSTDFFEGKNHFALYPHEQNQAIFQKVVDTGEPFSVMSKPFQHPNRPGEELTYWDWSLFPVKDEKGLVKRLVLTLVEVTDRIKADEALWENEKLLRKIAENYPNSYVSIIENDLTISFTSGQEYLKQNINPAQFAGMTLAQFFGSLASQVRLHYLQAFEGVEQSFELFFNDQYQRHHVVPLFGDEGEIHRILDVAENITERKKANQALQESERKLSTLMNNLPGIAYLCLNDKDWTMEFISNGCFKLTGYTAPELISNQKRSYADLIHPEDRDRVWKTVQAALETKQPFEMEYRIFTAEGKIKHVWEKGIGVFFKGKLQYLEGFITDISEQKQAKENVIQSEKNLRSFFNTVDDFVFILDMDGYIIDFNTTIPERLGYSRKELINKPVLLFHPPDKREEVSRIVEDMIKGVKEYCPIPLLKKNGELIPVETHVKQGTWNGRPVIFGISKDISDLKVSEEKFSKAFHSNPAIAGLSDLETGKYVEVNNTFYRKLGFSPEEVIGHRASEVVKMDLKFRERTLSRLKKYNHVDNEEAILYTKNGKPMDVLMSAEIIVLEGKKYNFTTATDITDRKKADAELTNYREQLEELVEARTRELEKRNKELEEMHKVFVGREFRINELKKQVKELKNMLGEE